MNTKDMQSMYFKSADSIKHMLECSSLDHQKEFYYLLMNIHTAKTEADLATLAIDMDSLLEDISMAAVNKDIQLQCMDWMLKRIDYLEHTDKAGVKAYKASVGGYWPQVEEDICENYDWAIGSNLYDYIQECIKRGI